MKRVIVVLLVGSSLTLAACGSGEEPSPEAAASTPAATAAPAKPAAGGESVAIKGFAFAPTTIKAKVGQKITWSNDDPAAHTVTAKSGGELDSGTIAQGSSFSFTPQQAGTIEYFCEIHPSMLGTIEVS
jgi:plastocyanin